MSGITLFRITLGITWTQLIYIEIIFRFKQCKWERDLLLYFFKQWKLKHVLYLWESNVGVMFDITEHGTSYSWRNHLLKKKKKKKYSWRNLMLKTARIYTRLSAYLVLKTNPHLLLVGPQWLSLRILYTVSYFSIP